LTVSQPFLAPEKHPVVSGNLISRPDVDCNRRGGAEHVIEIE
jgi:hypothetical protein